MHGWKRSAAVLIVAAGLVAGCSTGQAVDMNGTQQSASGPGSSGSAQSAGSGSARSAASADSASAASAGSGSASSESAGSAGSTGSAGGSTEGTADGQGGGTLVAAIGGEPDQLDPHKTTSYFSFEVLENVFDTLVEPDENLQMQPALATSWKVSDDQLTWTFTLRKGVTFQDGTPFTSADVKYSFDRIIDKKLSTAWRFSAVSSISTPDPDTVVIKVKQPSPNLLASIGGFKGVAIVEKANVTSGKIATHPVGTGPFAFSSWKSGESISLVANPHYWGGAPKIAGVTYRFVPEASTAIADLKSGQIQWTDSVPPQQAAALAKDDSVVLGRKPSNDYWYLALNEKRKPFDDVRVRQAIAYAIDRDAIAKVTHYGNATVNELAIPKTSQWYTAYHKYTHDPDKARALLSKAGVKDLTMQIMVTSDYPETVTAAQLIASELADIGITLKIRTLDFATWLSEESAGNFDMFMMGWLGNIDPDDFYYGQHHTGASNNYQGYSNPKVDALLDQGRTETDPAKRKQIYARAATMIADDASYIYLYNPDVLQVWSPALKGYQVRGDRAIRFRSVSLAG